MGKVGTGIGVTLGLLAVAGGATLGSLHINKQNNDIKSKTAEIVSYQEDLQNSNEHIILLQNGNKEYEKQLAQKDEIIANKDAEIAQKNQQIQELEANDISCEVTNVAKLSLYGQDGNGVIFITFNGERNGVLASFNLSVLQNYKNVGFSKYEEYVFSNGVVSTTAESTQKNYLINKNSLVINCYDANNNLITNLDDLPTNISLVMNSSMDYQIDEEDNSVISCTLNVKFVNYELPN